MKIFLFFLLIFHGLFISSIGQTLAFPGAEGYGKYSTGGRGGQVVAVTNLNDDGEGSLRWALRQYIDTMYVYKDSANPLFPITVYQPLTIVFNVSGIIRLKSDIKINRDNLTIAGQSAPCDGICIAGRSILLNGATTSQLFYWGPRRKNVIVRYMRFRPGVPLDSNGIPTSSFVTYGLDVENYENVIIDHCSISWANEECLAIYDNKYTTVQWCMVTEGLYSAYHPKGIRAYGGVWGGQFASYYHNLIAHQNSRTPRFNGARAHDTIAIIDYRNNVNYNWLISSATYGGDVEINGGIARLNEVNNFYKPGPATSSTHKLMRPDYSANATGVGRFHVEGNVIDGNIPRTSDNWLAVDFAYIPTASRDSSRSDSLFTINVPLQMQSAQNAFDTVLAAAGAVLPRRDSVDMRIAKEAKNRTTSGTGSSNKPGIIDSPAAVGGWPSFNNCSGPTDTDLDGMPDDWEIEHQLNPHFSGDRNSVDSNGYTMLENYLNGIVAPLTVKKVCAGNDSIILSSDVRGNSYQWEENTGNGFISINGQTDSILSIQLPSSAYGNQYRSKVNNSGYSSIIKIKFESIWTGLADSAWENPANWNCNQVPDMYTDAIIPSGSLIINSNAVCRSIRLNAAEAAVTINADYHLEVMHE